MTTSRYTTPLHDRLTELHNLIATDPTRAQQAVAYLAGAFSTTPDTSHQRFILNWVAKALDHATPTPHIPLGQVAHNLRDATGVEVEVNPGDYEGAAIIYYQVEEEVETGRADDRWGVVTSERVELVDYDIEVMTASDLVDTLTRLDGEGAVVVCVEVSDNIATDLLTPIPS